MLDGPSLPLGPHNGVGRGDDTREPKLPRDVLELLGTEDAAFVRTAYKVILRREPDPGGFSHYLRRLRSGADKLEILRDLRMSPEGESKGSDLPGLSQSLKGLWWGRVPIVASYVKARNRKLALRAQLEHARVEAEELRKNADKSASDLQSFLAFDAQQYLSVNEDVATAAMNPY